MGTCLSYYLEKRKRLLEKFIGREITFIQSDNLSDDIIYLSLKIIDLWDGNALNNEMFECSSCRQFNLDPDYDDPVCEKCGAKLSLADANLWYDPDRTPQDRPAKLSEFCKKE